MLAFLHPACCKFTFNYMLQVYICLHTRLHVYILHCFMPAQLLDTVPCQKQQALPQLLAKSDRAKFSKHPEWDLERQRIKIAETFFGGFSSLEILYIFCHIYCCWASFLISANFPKYPARALERQKSNSGEANLLACFTDAIEAISSWRESWWPCKRNVAVALCPTIPDWCGNCILSNNTCCMHKHLWMQVYSLILLVPCYDTPKRKTCMFVSWAYAC